MTIGQTMLPSASDSLAIHTLTGNLEQGNVFMSFRLLSKKLSRAATVLKKRLVKVAWVLCTKGYA